MPSEAKPLRHLAPVPSAYIQRCFSCADTEDRLAIATANYHRLRAEVDRLKRALQRESHSMDPSEPHRRKV